MNLINCCCLFQDISVTVPPLRLATVVHRIELNRTVDVFCFSQSGCHLLDCSLFWRGTGTVDLEDRVEAFPWEACSTSLQTMRASLQGGDFWVNSSSVPPSVCCLYLTWQEASCMLVKDLWMCVVGVCVWTCVSMRHSFLPHKLTEVWGCISFFPLSHKASLRLRMDSDLLWIQRCLEHLIILPPLPKCTHHRHSPSCLVYALQRTMSSINTLPTELLASWPQPCPFSVWHREFQSLEGLMT